MSRKLYWVDEATGGHGLITVNENPQPNEKQSAEIQRRTIEANPTPAERDALIEKLTAEIVPAEKAEPPAGVEVDREAFEDFRADVITRLTRQVKT